MSFYFKRNFEIYISTEADSSANATNTVILDVKDFSFNQSSSMSKVQRNTLDPNQERTVDPHISTIAPASFQFTTYILPIIEASNVTSPEEYLWISLLGVDSLTSNSTSSTIDFANGNVSALKELTIWFSHPNRAEGNYRLNNAIIDSATISFDINGIAEIKWQGRALEIVEDNSPPIPGVSAINLTNKTSYLKNKLSTLSVTSGASFDMALTNGELKIENNNTFYNSSALGQVTLPVGHYTGNREIAGTLTVYMRAGTNRSVDLFNQILNNIKTSTYEANYLANISINIGGSTSPQYVTINIPQVLFDLPPQNFEDVITLNLPFTAKEESGNYCQVIYNITP